MVGAGISTGECRELGFGQMKSWLQRQPETCRVCVCVWGAFITDPLPSLVIEALLGSESAAKS